MILAFSFSFSDGEKVRFSPTNSLVLSFRAKALSSALQTFLDIKNTGSKFNTFKHEHYRESILIDTGRITSSSWMKSFVDNCSNSNRFICQFGTVMTYLITTWQPVDILEIITNINNLFLTEKLTLILAKQYICKLCSNWVDFSSAALHFRNPKKLDVRSFRCIKSGSQYSLSFCVCFAAFFSQDVPLPL